MKRLVLVYLLIPTIVIASPIYKWEDEAGVIHYSSKPSGSAKEAQLPDISRGEFKYSMKRADVKDLTCDDHGGVDCPKGADKDGSVLCVDGFADAKARFTFSCSSPKLIVTDISDPDPDGKHKVFVRNNNSVIAKKPTIWLKMKNGQQIKLEGPEQIGSYEIAEFSLKIPPGDTFKEKPKVTELTVTCANC